MKILRLFISSTFEDFRLERDALHEEVFPYIADICASYGFDFLPIDLRWGVTTRAQLDQKTMEICLNEIKSCMDDPHPDFIVLTGDRYGWIPLSYFIEKKEFDILTGLIEAHRDEKEVREWYTLDENQCPPSYSLKKREGKFVEPNEWEKIENKLRLIMQAAISKYTGTFLTQEAIQKYFSSATEQEFNEYKKSWSDPKEHSIFIVERKIDNIDDFPITKYVDANQNQRLSAFKNELRKIADKNYIEVTASLKDKETLTSDHIKIMVDSLKKQLKESITKEVERNNNSKPDKPKKTQKLHKKRLLEEKILGREDEIEKIIEYTNDHSNSQPLIVHGNYGMGKSTIMANAIKKSKGRPKTKSSLQIL